MEENSSIAVVKAICYILFMLLGVTGNGLVCMAVWKKQKLRTLPNYLVFSLAISDFLFCTTVVPCLLITTIANSWILGNSLCQVSGFLTTYFCVISISTLVLITVNRYFAVGRPQKYSSIFNVRRIFCSIGIIWIYGAVVAAPPLLGWSRIRSGDNFCTIDGRKHVSYATFIILVAYFIPFFIQIALYAKIFLILKKHKREMKKKLGVKCQDYDEYSSSEAGSLRLRAKSSVQNNQPGKLMNKTENKNEDKGMLRTEKPGPGRDIEQQGNGSVLASNGKIHRSQSNENFGQYPTEEPVMFRRSSSIHLARPASDASAISVNNVDVQGLEVYRNKLYVNNVSVYENETSCDRSSTKFSGYRDSDLNINHDITRANRSSSKLATLANTLRKVKPSLRAMSKEAKTTRMIFVVVAAFFICWTPLAIGSILYAFGIASPDFDQVSFGIIFACLNSVCNPIIYAFMNTQFRRAFIEIVNQGRMCRCKQ